MGTLEKFSGKVVFIDTAPLVYHIEKVEKYRSVLQKFFEELDRGNFRAITSIVTFMEVLVKPYRDGLLDLTFTFEKAILKSHFLEMSNINLDIARKSGTNQIKTKNCISRCNSACHCTIL